MLQETLLTQIRWNRAILELGEAACLVGRPEVALHLYVRAERCYAGMLDELSTLSDADADSLEPAVTDFEGASLRLSVRLRPLVD
jgi:hypothetical protein